MSQIGLVYTDVLPAARRQGELLRDVIYNGLFLFSNLLRAAAHR